MTTPGKTVWVMVSVTNAEPAQQDEHADGARQRAEQSSSTSARAMNGSGERLETRFIRTCGRR